MIPPSIKTRVTLLGPVSFSANVRPEVLKRVSAPKEDTVQYYT